MFSLELYKVKVYGLALSLSILTFMASNMFADDLRVLITMILFFVYIEIALYLLKRKKLILQIHNTPLDKDVKLYIYLDNKKLGFEKIRHTEDLTSYKIELRIKSFLERFKSTFLKEDEIFLLGFTEQEEKFITTAIQQFNKNSITKKEVTILNTL